MCHPLRQVDANGDARVAFDEFVRVMAPLLQDSSGPTHVGSSALVEERAPGEEGLVLLGASVLGLPRWQASCLRCIADGQACR